jgi:hypothetical protein
MIAIKKLQRGGGYMTIVPMPTTVELLFFVSIRLRLLFLLSSYDTGNNLSFSLS